MTTIEHQVPAKYAPRHAAPRHAAPEPAERPDVAGRASGDETLERFIGAAIEYAAESITYHLPGENCTCDVDPL